MGLLEELVTGSELLFGQSAQRNEVIRDLDAAHSARLQVSGLQCPLLSLRSTGRRPPKDRIGRVACSSGTGAGHQHCRVRPSDEYCDQKRFFPRAPHRKSMWHHGRPMVGGENYGKAVQAPLAVVPRFAVGVEDLPR
jgi:hypothetical protein